MLSLCKANVFSFLKVNAVAKVKALSFSESYAFNRKRFNMLRQLTNKSS